MLEHPYYFLSLLFTFVACVLSIVFIFAIREKRVYNVYVLLVAICIWLFGRMLFTNVETEDIIRLKRKILQALA